METISCDADSNHCSLLPVDCWMEIFSHLDSCSLRQCAAVSSVWRDLSRTTWLWKELCVARWGSAVLRHDNIYSVDWFQYYRKRSCKAHWIRPSPLGFIQETYHKEPWKLLASIILTSRTTTCLKHDIVQRFFSMWPSPSSVIAGSASAMKYVLQKLGLQDVRVKFVKAFCEGFLLVDWDEPKELKGVGTLGNDSWRLFCGWDVGPVWHSLHIDDSNVRHYQRWLITSHGLAGKEASAAAASKRKVTQEQGEIQKSRAALPDNHGTTDAVCMSTPSTSVIKSSRAVRSSSGTAPNNCDGDKALCRQLSRRPGLRLRAANASSRPAAPGTEERKRPHRGSRVQENTDSFRRPRRQATVAGTDVDKPTPTRRTRTGNIKNKKLETASRAPEKRKTRLKQTPALHPTSGRQSSAGGHILQHRVRPRQHVIPSATQMLK